MSLAKISRRTLVILGLVGTVIAASATQASAFGGRGMGGGFGGGFGGNFGGGRGIGAMRPVNINIGGRLPIGGLGGRPIRPGNIMCFRAPCNIGHRPPPIWNCRFTHSCGGRIPISCRFHPYLPFCGGRPPVWYPRPVYAVPVTTAYRAAAPVYRAPAAAPAPVPAVCTPPGPFISVIFQVNATAGDIAQFLNTYAVQMAQGPSSDGIFQLKLNTPLPPDQMKSMIESMRTQTNVVSQVNG